MSGDRAAIANEKAASRRGAGGPGTGGRMTAAFVALMFAAFVESMGSFLVLALLPFYGQRFGATPTLVGWLVATFALAQLLSAPLWGRLSDAIGRKVVLLVGLAVTAGAYLLFAEADSLVTLFLSRALQGLGAGTVSVVFAYLADVLPREQRAEGIGWITAATSGAAMVGPVLGSVAARYDPAYPGYWSFGMAVVSFLMVAVLLPRPEARKSSRSASSSAAPEVVEAQLPEPQVQQADQAVGSMPRGLRQSAQGDSLIRALGAVVFRPFSAAPILVWTYAVGMIATSATFGVIGLFLEQRFAVDEQSIWKFFSLLAGVSLVFRVWVLGPMVRRFGERRLIVAGLALLGFATLGLVLPSQALWLAIPIFLFACGQSLLYPCTTAQLSQVIELQATTSKGEGSKAEGASGLQGQAMGVQQAYGGASRVLGPVAGGWAFAQLGPPAPFIVSGAVVLIWALVLAAKLKAADREFPSQP